MKKNVKSYLRVVFLFHIAYREFQGPAIAMVGNWVTKIAAEKIENIGLIFSAQFSSLNITHLPPPPFAILSLRQIFLRIYPS